MCHDFDLVIAFLKACAPQRRAVKALFEAHAMPLCTWAGNWGLFTEQFIAVPEQKPRVQPQLDEMTLRRKIKRANEVIVSQ